MKFGKKSLCLLLAASMMVVTLGGCLKDSSQQSATVQVDYNAEEEVAKYKDHLGELSEADKNYVVQMGYNNCDHMVASLVGEGSGIFDALGLNVNRNGCRLPGNRRRGSFGKQRRSFVYGSGKPSGRFRVSGCQQ